MGNNVKIITVDVRDDGSVVVYYSTGTCRPYKADRLPKTVKAWLDDNGSERVVVKATENAVVIEAVKEDAETTEQATESTAQTSEQATENETEHTSMIAAIDQARPVKTVSEPLKPLKRWIIPTIPYLIAYGAIKVLIGIVAILASVAGATETAGEIIQKVMRETIKPTVKKATKATMKYMQTTGKQIKTWWKESMQFRGELIEEWKEPDWI